MKKIKNYEFKKYFNDSAGTVTHKRNNGKPQYIWSGAEERGGKML